jgi:hypothetical protein
MHAQRARSLSSSIIRMPFPERRHLLGRLLNEIPGRANPVRPPNRPYPYAHPYPVLSSFGLCANHKLQLCTLPSAVYNSRPCVELSHCNTAPNSLAICNAAELALAANRPTQDSWVTNPPYDSRCDKGKLADLPEPQRRHALFVIAMRDMATIESTPLSKTDSVFPEARAFFA